MVNISLSHGTFLTLSFLFVHRYDDWTFLMRYKTADTKKGDSINVSRIRLGEILLTTEAKNHEWKMRMLFIIHFCASYSFFSYPLNNLCALCCPGHCFLSALCLNYYYFCMLGTCLNNLHSFPFLFQVFLFGCRVELENFFILE